MKMLGLGYQREVKKLICSFSHPHLRNLCKESQQDHDSLRPLAISLWCVGACIAGVGGTP